MRTKWRLHRSREATAYLVGLRDAGRGIRQVIDLLAQHGIPATADKDETEEPATYTWTAVGHIITCIVAEEEQAIYVAVVEPLDITSTDIASN